MGQHIHKCLSGLLSVLIQCTYDISAKLVVQIASPIYSLVGGFDHRRGGPIVDGPRPRGYKKIKRND